MTIDYNSQYSDIDKQLMQQIYEKRHTLDLIDIMLLRNLNDKKLLQQHFNNKFKKEEKTAND